MVCYSIQIDRRQCVSCLFGPGLTSRMALPHSQRRIPWYDLGLARYPVLTCIPERASNDRRALIEPFKATWSGRGNIWWTIGKIDLGVRT
jgi:hypothetical protein